MTLTLDVARWMSLPRLNAREASALAQELARAAHDPHTDLPLPLSTFLASALEAMIMDWRSLEAAVAAAADQKITEGEADRREDTAVAALHDFLAGWARLESELPQGRMAANAYRRIFGTTGLALVELPAKTEWAAVEARLKIIDSEGLGQVISELGGALILDHLRMVHAIYGQAVGATPSDAPAIEPTPVRMWREALLDSMRTYVLRAAASVERDQPGTQALADRLLAPLRHWRDPGGGRAAKWER